MSNQQGLQSLSGIEDINPSINFDFKEISPFQEGVMSEIFQRLDKSFFQEPKELGDLINKGKLNSENFAKADRYRHSFKGNPQESIERDTFTSRH